MSIEDFKKFGQMCAENEELRKKAKEIGVNNLEGLVQLGKEVGLNFTVDDIKAFAQEVKSGEGELSEEQLEKVAGGAISMTAAAVVGAVVGAASLGVQVGSEASRNW